MYDLDDEMERMVTPFDVSCLSLRQENYKDAELN